MNPTLSATQRKILWALKRTGLYAGKDAFGRFKFMEDKFPLRSLLALRKRGLIEHFCAGQWYLTKEGIEVMRRGV